MKRHGIVTRDSRVTSRVSHGDVTRCVTWPVTVPRPDPTRPTLVTVVSGVSGTTSIDLTVGVESPPEAWMETHSLEDWDPPCEYSIHERFGSGPAEWAIFLRPTAPCGCTLPPVVLFCGPCWTHRSQMKVGRCNLCGASDLPADIIIRVEPLR